MRVMIWIAAMVSSAMRRPSTRHRPQLRKMGQLSGGPGPEAHNYATDLFSGAWNSVAFGGLWIRKPHICTWRTESKATRRT